MAGLLDVALRRALAEVAESGGGSALRVARGAGGNTLRSVAQDDLSGPLRAWAEPSATREQLASAGMLPVLPGDTRISSRFPTAVNAPDNPLRTQLGIDMRSYMQPTPRGDPFTHNMGLVTREPGFAKFADMTPEQAYRGAAEQMAGNMQFIRQNAPPAFLERSPHWYEGANQISGALADRWGVPRQSASGALAGLSPQKDWFQNVSNAERTGDILFGPAASRGMTGEMQRIFPSIEGFKSKGNRDLFRQIQGKKLQDILREPDGELKAAMWIRLYDEAHHSPFYRSITPEGMFGPHVLTDKNEPAKRAWNSNLEI